MSKRILELGIERNFDKEKNILEYIVNTDSADKTQTPREFSKYVKRVVGIIGEDSKKHNALSDMGIYISGKHSEQLKQEINKLTEKSKKQYERFGEMHTWPMPLQTLVCGLGTVGGLVGLIRGYGFGSEFSTRIAASIIGAVLGTAGGVGVGFLFSIPIIRYGFPLAHKSEQYKRIKEAIN